LNIVFDRVDNLEKGATVKLHGLTIGEVTNLNLLRDSVIVEIKLNQQQKIPTGSTFLIVNSLLGSASIIIEPSGQETFLKQIDTAKGSYETKTILDKFFSDSLNRQKAKDAIDKISVGLKKLNEEGKDSLQ
jgi:ABC-type transporter Mla subunit MlaD